MANLKDVIYLSNEDYETLVSTGTVTIDGDTLTYDENNVYITPEIVASSTQDGLMSASDKIKLDSVETTYLPLTGGEITGNVIINGMHRDQYYASNICRFFSNQTPTEYVIKTKIRYASGSYMPVIRIYGYAYGLQCPIELRVGFYIYNDNLGWSGAVSTGAWKPEVYLFRYTDNSVNYVAVGFKGSCYFPGFQVDAQVGALGNFGIVFNPEGWSVISNGSDTTVHLIPDVGTDKCIQVSYKTMKTDVEGYSTYIKDGTYAYTPTSIHTALDNKLSTSGGTLSLANADSLKIKRTSSGSGAFIAYYNNNQNTNCWFVGMDTSGSFKFNYNNVDKAYIDTAGNFYENGTSLSSKYGRLGSANTWSGNNTFSGALSATDGVSLSADSGDVAFSVSPSGIDLNSRYGVNIYASERGYASASEPIRYASGVSPSNSSDLVTKGYVDNKTYATSIATSSGTNQLTLAFGTKYALTAGGTSYIFTMPSNPNTNQTVKVGSSTFGANAAVGFVAGTRITVTPDTTNNTITIATSATADSAITNTQIDTLF